MFFKRQMSRYVLRLPAFFHTIHFNIFPVCDCHANLQSRTSSLRPLLRMLAWRNARFLTAGEGERGH